jgi:hypothetical protein
MRGVRVGKRGESQQFSRPASLNEHRHCQPQSSVGGMRRLSVAVYIAFRQTRIEITYKLLDMRKLLVEIIESKKRKMLCDDVRAIA